MKNTRVLISSAGLVLFSAWAVVDAPNLYSQNLSARTERIDLSFSFSRPQLYDGDATVGAISASSYSAVVSFRALSPLGVEAFVSYTPHDDDPYHWTPRILLPGAWVTLSLLPNPAQGLDLYFAGGGARASVSEVLDLSGCTPEVGCFAEGGPNFSNGTEWVGVFGAGIRYPAIPRLTVHAGVKALASSSLVGNLRFYEIGGGIRVR